MRPPPIKRRALLAAPLLLPLLRPRRARAGGWPRVLTDGLGRALTLDAPPRRIVAIFSSNVELLAAVGAADRIVGIEEFTRFPPEVAALPKVGGRLGFSAEAIAALRPGLVVMTPARNAAHALTEPMARIGVPVLVVTHRDVPQIFANLRLLGAATGEEARAEALVARLEARIAAVAARLSGRAPVRVFLETSNTGRGAFGTVRPGTYTADALALAGGASVFPALSPNAPAQVSGEAILRADPRCYLVAGQVDGVAGRTGFFRAVGAARGAAACRQPGAVPHPRAARGGWRGKPVAPAAPGMTWLLPPVGFLLGLLLGADTLGPAEALALLAEPAQPLARLVWQWRLPRVLAAGCVGALLALGGAVFQGVFRNPLAEPYLLGSAGGAAVGATVALLVALPLPATLALPVLAFLGAWGATWLVLALARVAGTASVAALLLAGVAVAALLGALRSFLMLALSDETVSLQAVLSWALGGVQTPSWPELAVLAALTLAALLLCRALAHGLDLLGLGEAMAESFGLNPRRFVALAVLAGAGIVAVSVVWGGLVGFVGLMAPHLARWRVGPLHAALLPRAAAIGAGLAMACDGIARSVLPPAEIPLGLVTALLGAPFFLVILAREARRG
jgi:iron complex transport system permease protein